MISNEKHFNQLKTVFSVLHLSEFLIVSHLLTPLIIWIVIRMLCIKSSVVGVFFNMLVRQAK